MQSLKLRIRIIRISLTLWLLPDSINKINGAKKAPTKAFRTLA